MARCGVETIATQGVEQRLPYNHVVGRQAIDDQELDINGSTPWFHPKGCSQPHISSDTDPFSREANKVAMIWVQGGFTQLHLLEHCKEKYIRRAPLIH